MYRIVASQLRVRWGWIKLQVVLKDSSCDKDTCRQISSGWERLPILVTFVGSREEKHGEIPVNKKLLSSRGHKGVVFSISEWLMGHP